jgi:hypothetical protein
MNQAFSRVSLLFLLASLALSLSGTRVARVLCFGSTCNEVSPAPQPKVPAKAKTAANVLGNAEPGIMDTINFLNRFVPESHAEWWHLNAYQPNLVV